MADAAELLIGVDVTCNDAATSKGSSSTAAIAV
jgi:hypothetical protein